MEDKETFTYTYSAQQQRQIREIREKYIPQLPAVPDKLDELKALDKSVSRAGLLPAILVGVIGALTLGAGMSCALVWDRVFLGILLGIIGLGVMALALPLHNRLCAKRRDKVAPMILALTDELMQ